jgi:Ubiquitin C-terminal hydrolase
VKLKKIRNDHLKEDAFQKSIDYWRKFLKKNHSVVIDVFTGLYFSQIICSNCKNNSFSHESFNLITLSIPSTDDKMTLQKCLENNFNTNEQLNGDNKYHCDNCCTMKEEKYNATKNVTIWYPPSRLIIQFKRFINTGNSTYINDKLVKFPLAGLDLKPFMSAYVDGEYTYDLYGVIYHFGNLRGGHYIAYTKNIINSKWYLFDDSHVLHLDDNKIEEQLNNSGAYVLFYKNTTPYQLHPMTNLLVINQNNC